MLVRAPVAFVVLPHTNVADCVFAGKAVEQLTLRKAALTAMFFIAPRQLVPVWTASPKVRLGTDVTDLMGTLSALPSSFAVHAL